MKALILAGGFGTRLRPVIGDDMPKCLAPVMGKPMVSYVINRMRKQGIDDITLALHYKAEKFVEKFGDSVKYQIEDEPLGTGGAIKKFCEGKTEPVLVSNGDTIAPIDYMDMKRIGYAPLVVARWNGVSAGTYIMNPNAVEYFPDKFSFEEYAVPRIHREYYEIPWFTDLGTPESYNKVAKDWA